MAFHDAIRYLCYGQKYPDYGFYCTRFGLRINKVPGLQIKVPELRVLPYEAFIIGENVFPLYCE